MNEDRDALIHACLANPVDEGPRLVLSDWLEEHGWHGLPLAALRGEGQWRCSRYNTKAYWQYSIDSLLRHLHPEAYPNKIAANLSSLEFFVDGMPICSSCERDDVVYWHDRRWVCSPPCERSDIYAQLARQYRRAYQPFGGMLSVAGSPEPMRYTGDRPHGDQDRHDAMAVAMYDRLLTQINNARNNAAMELNVSEIQIGRMYPVGTRLTHNELDGTIREATYGEGFFCTVIRSDPRTRTMTIAMIR